MWSPRDPRASAWLAPIVAALAIAGPLPGQGTPVVHEPGWVLVAQVSLGNGATGAEYNPLDDCFYVGGNDSSGSGLYRITPNYDLEFVTYMDRPSGLVVDHDDGDVFVSEVYSGRVYRVGFGETTRTQWVSGFHSGDDDPNDLAIAPNDYTGPLLQPGEAVVVDGGYNSNAQEDVYGWSPDTPQGEFLVHDDDGTLRVPYGVAVTRSAIYIPDRRPDDTGVLYRVEADGSLTEVVTQTTLPRSGEMTVDPVNQDLILAGGPTELVVRIDPETGSVSNVVSGVPSAYGVDISPDGRKLSVMGDDVVYIFERELAWITSNDPGTAFPTSGGLSSQLAQLNSAPPGFDPQTWQAVARHTDLASTTGFQCGTAGIASTGAPMVEATPPASVYHNQWENDVRVRVFDERIGWTLTQPVTVDVESPAGQTFDVYTDMPPTQPVLPVGSVVNSHLIHFDTVGNNRVVHSGAQVTFETPIRALIARGANINASDGELGIPGVSYSAPLVERGMELGDVEDWISVSADGRTLTMGTLVMNWLDEIRVLTEPPADPLTLPYVATVEPLAGIDEVTYDNCSSAWYRFTFDLPGGAKSPRLEGLANVDDQGVLFLNGHRVTGLMTQPGCDPADPGDPNDPCYALQDTGSDGVDGSGLVILTAPTPDAFEVTDAALFVPGENELVFAVCGDASALEPTGLEFRAALYFEPASTSYCAAKTDSVGCTPSIASTGIPSITSPTPFLVTASGVRNQKAGILFYGFAPNSAPWRGGTLCVQAPIRRTPLQQSGGSPAGDDCTGSFAFDFNAWAQSGADPALAVDVEVFGQYWYRDPQGSFGSGISDALRFEVCP